MRTTRDETLPLVDSEAGIDLGLTHFAVMSDGTKVTAPKFLRRAARKLKRLQQALSARPRAATAACHLLATPDNEHPLRRP